MLPYWGMGNAKFTLRFEDSETHDLLRLVAGDLGVSMNKLAGELIARELRVAALALEDELRGTLEALRSYRGERVEEDLVAFAHAEASIEDPLAARMVAGAVSDPHGIAAAFG